MMMMMKNVKMRVREIGIRNLISHSYRSVDNASEDKALSGHCRNL